MYRRASGLAVVLVLLLTIPTAALANHPVLVEGNCHSPLPGQTSVPPGTCGDFDGDGLIGTAEDTDNMTDRIFGTITAALAVASNGANQNGRVTIVASGRFPEALTITAANGNVTLAAAPGVEANIDAVLSGDPGNGVRQGQPGIVVNAAANRRVTIQNVVVRNWTEGIRIQGASHVTLEDVRIENNVNYGILVEDSARVAVNRSSVLATGYRTGVTGSFPSDANVPDPGIGIAFEDASRGFVAFTLVTGSFKTGIADASSQSVQTKDNVVFDNNPNTKGFDRY